MIIIPFLVPRKNGVMGSVGWLFLLQGTLYYALKQPHRIQKIGDLKSSYSPSFLLI